MYIIQLHVEDNWFNYYSVQDGDVIANGGEAYLIEWILEDKRRRRSLSEFMFPYRIMYRGYSGGDLIPVFSELEE